MFTFYLLLRRKWFLPNGQLILRDGSPSACNVGAWWLIALTDPSFFFVWGLSQRTTTFILRGDLDPRTPSSVVKAYVHRKFLALATQRSVIPSCFWKKKHCPVIGLNLLQQFLLAVAIFAIITQRGYSSATHADGLFWGYSGNHRVFVNQIRGQNSYEL